MSRFTLPPVLAVQHTAVRDGAAPACCAWTTANCWCPSARGLGQAELPDHHPDRGWWLRLDDDVTAVPDLVRPGHPR
ncbi:hypothetical protein [Saccharothrix yanglingensis]|uniref:hypothetical protein n=1 Tax=Saccharothrix yanglingensis TaxID=659496 RepID=UPI0027D245C4|nr:hypothetical protein [Saccharothrix yanglingensis]